MRIVVRFDLDNNVLPRDYRSTIVSYIKNALANHSEGRFYEHFYPKNITSNMQPQFSWSLQLVKPKFLKDHIEVEKPNVEMTITVPDRMDTLVLYNALINQSKKVFPMPLGNGMRLTRIRIDKDKSIGGNVVQFKLLSPLCLRIHNEETNIDNYVTCEDDNFVEELKNNLERSFPKYLESISTLKVDSQRLSKQVIPLYGQMIELSIGEILLMGDSELLNELYQRGIGSRRKLGFGLLKIIDEWGVRL